MTLKGVMAVTLRYFTEFGNCVPTHRPAVTASICGGIWLCMSLLYFVVRVRCCHKVSSRSLSHLLMSFLVLLLLLSSFSSSQNSDVAIRFSDLDFLKGSNNLGIRLRFYAVTLTFDIWPWTPIVAYIGYRVIKLSTKFNQNRTIHTVKLLMI